MVAWLAVSALAIAGLWLADKLLLRAETRGWRYCRRRRGSPGTSAAAALTLQALFRPEAQYALTQLVDREASRRDDDEGDGPRGGHR